MWHEKLQLCLGSRGSLGWPDQMASFLCDSCQPSPAFALLNILGHGGYAGVRLGEAQNPGPATNDRDQATAEQCTANLRRINEARDSVPGSQDSVTRGVQNLQTLDTPTSQTAPPAPPPPTMPGSRRPQARPKQQLQEYLWCAQPLTTAPCCTRFRSTGDNGCSQRALRNFATLTVQPVRNDVAGAPPAKSDTPLRVLRVGGTFQDRRQPGHQDAAISGMPAGQ